MCSATVSSETHCDTAMVGFTATGSYDGDSNVVTARSIVVVLK
jgi:hypothetical protein